MKNAKNYTLRSIAQQLDIHVSTVSRVLRGDAETVRKAAAQATIEKIRALAAEHGYTPNPHAISLRTRQSRLIGVSVPRLSDIIWATIYEGIEETALEKGYFAYVTNSYDRPEVQKKQVGLALARRVDGLIIGDARTSPESLEFLEGLSVPFVLALRHTGEYPSVTCDDYDGGRQAAKHLFTRGHRQVAVLAGSATTSTGQERTAGFVEYYREVGYPITVEKVVFSHFDTRSGREAAQRLFSLFPSLTAIYAVNDFAAIGAMGAAREAGLVPGYSLALIGYNDTPLAGELPIPLTTLRNPVRELGEESMKLLFKLLAGEACPNIVLQPRLVIRESSNFSARSLLC